jgi:ketosteroid isomerase-like protein
MQAFYTGAILISKQNVEVVERLVKAFNSRDDETVASMLAPEVEFESLTMQTYTGRAGLLDYRNNLDDAWAEWRTEADRFLAARSERVVHLHRVVGRGRGSDIPVAQDIAILWTLTEGRVVRGKAFLDQEEALKAAGLEG